MSKLMTLLVEDDAFQREVLADVLKDEGFEVVECASAEAAELIVTSAGTELRALITDQNLAGQMTGAALAEYARCKHPCMNIVLMSGTQVEPTPAITTFLQKPFAPELRFRTLPSLPVNDVVPLSLVSSEPGRFRTDIRVHRTGNGNYAIGIVRRRQNSGPQCIYSVGDENSHA